MPLHLTADASTLSGDTARFVRLAKRCEAAWLAYAEREDPRLDRKVRAMDARLFQLEERIYGQPVRTLDDLAARAYVAKLHATHSPNGELWRLNNGGRDERALAELLTAVLAVAGARAQPLGGTS